VGRVASGLGEELEALPDLPTPKLRFERHVEKKRIVRRIPDSEIVHSFNLRPDFKTEFSLPEDFTADEAERLAAFLRTLPFPS
jgi:hypothetical protein